MADGRRGRHRSRAVAVAALCALLLPIAARSQPDEEVLRDQASVLASDAVLQGAVDYCGRAAPSAAPGLRAAHAGWRRRHLVEALRAQLAALAPATVQKLEQGARAAEEKLAGQGAPEPLCRQIARSASGPDLDMRAKHPRAYAGQGVASLAGGAVRGAPAGPAAEPGRPTGTVVNPAQLTAMLERGRKAEGTIASLRAAGLTGRLFIRGTVVARGESTFLELVRGPFRSRLSVSTGLDLHRHEGQELVVAGELDGWPSSVAFLRHTRLVEDPSGLVASAEPEEPGLVREPLEAEAVRTAPGKGLPERDLQGVFYRNYFVGSVLNEEITLLLEDGTGIQRDDVPPADLDVARSRAGEPQRWLRWKGGGGKVKVQRQDKDGKPRGDWEEWSGVVHGPWPAGQRLEGSYTARSFHGSIALGGTYFSSTLVFHRDGRFEESRLARSSSSSIAALQGFSASGASHSDATGTRGSAGGGDEGVFARVEGSRDDGADHRGTYALGGYTLELRFDSGRAERRLCFPKGEKGLFLYGATFQRD